MDYKILIVDDEPDIVSMLASFFTGNGYQALTAHSGMESLRRVEQNPDIILLDINMPDMDGLEVCELIRDRVSCPILFLTARIEDRDKVKGFFAGGDDYILKPFSLMELEARVCAHLRREARHKADTRLRACLISSDEDGNEGESKNLSRNNEFTLTIFPKPAEFIQPAEKALYHPTTRQHNKSV